MGSDHAATLAELLTQRFAIDMSIAHLIGRPAEKGHIGAFIAEQVLGIDLLENASNKGYDGRFSDGPLNGCTVNVKFLIGDTLVDIAEGADVDYYLVLKGPVEEAQSTREPRSLAVESVYLFDAKELLQQQVDRGAKLGIASSTTRQQRDAAMIYPQSHNKTLRLTAEQVSKLALFSAQKIKSGIAAS